MKASLSYKGIDQLLNHLDKAATLKDAQNIVKSNTADLSKRMQSQVPVDTGFLRRSIKMSISDGGFTGLVHPTAEYSPYVEYGTRFMSAQPFIKPSFEVQKAIFIKDMLRLVR